MTSDSVDLTAGRVAQLEDEARHEAEIVVAHLGQHVPHSFKPVVRFRDDVAYTFFLPDNPWETIWLTPANQVMWSRRNDDNTTSVRVFVDGEVIEEIPNLNAR